MRWFLCGALICVLSPLAASKTFHKGSRHAWDRPVGDLLARRHARSELPAKRIANRIHTTTKDVRAALLELSTHPEVSVKLITPSYAMMQVYRVDLPAKPKPRDPPPLNASISSWVHGTEPVGALVAPKFVQRMLKHKSYRRKYNTTLFVKLDPYGTRKTPWGFDLNRCFRDGRWTPETNAIRRSVDNQQYDVFVDLHSSTGDRGSWMVRAADDGTLTRRALAATRSETLWDRLPHKATSTSKLTGASFSFHCLGGVCSNTAGTFKGWMASRGTRYSYTLETPNHLPHERQVARSLKLLESTLFNVAKYGRFDQR